MKMNSRQTEIHIYGDIGGVDDADMSAAKFVGQLAEAKGKDIALRISSFGGSVADGIAIYNAAKRYPGNITTYIDSIAASIAALVAMSGEKIIMARNALMMIHAPHAGAYGNASDMREAADMLDKFADAMVIAHSEKSGVSIDAVKALIGDGKDHWFTAEEALAAGLIDEISEDFDISVLPAAARFDPDKPATLLTSVPAAAGIFNKPPKQESHMAATKEPVNPAASDPKPAGTNVPQDPQVNADDIKAQVLAAETKRRGEIRASFSPLMNKFPSSGLGELMNQCLDDSAISVEAASKMLMQKLGENTEPTAGNFHHRIEMGQTDSEKFRIGASEALMVQAGIANKEMVSKSASNNFRGYTLLELARAALHINGVNSSGMGKMDVVANAFTHTSSDFTSLLANVAEKSMMMGYDEAEETFQAWTMRGSASDFKAVSRVDLNAFPSLEKVNEGGEYNYGTIGDRGETVQLATYGKLFSITRQAIINDDLRAFTMIPRRMGRAAIRTVGDLVYAVLTSNPTMSDGIALFHASHNNLLTGASIATSSVDAMRVAMATQTDASTNATALNIRLANLLVPVALEGTAKVVANSEFEVGASTKNNTIPNSVRGTFGVISDARLDASSATVWYGSANPGMHDTVEVTYLDGQDTPYLESKNGWNVDGAEFKVRIDAAVNPLDFRTMAKNPGA